VIEIEAKIKKVEVIKIQEEIFKKNSEIETLLNSLKGKEKNLEGKLSDSDFSPRAGNKKKKGKEEFFIDFQTSPNDKKSKKNDKKRSSEVKEINKPGSPKFNSPSLKLVTKKSLDSKSKELAK
jgi:hypothetical protein